MKIIFAKIIIFLMLFCFVGITSAEDIHVVSSLADLEYIVNSTWVSNSINRLMPPAKDCVYNNSLGAIAYNDGFDTNFIASLTPVLLYNGTNEFVMYPVEVIETNNISGRVRNYYSAISTNPAVLHSNDVSIANYPISWIEDIYGEPPAYLSGSAIQDWYDACDPMRQHVLCDLLPTNSVPDYLIMLTNSVGYYTQGTNTNSVLSLYSNCIAVVQCSISAEDAELYLHAPDDISMLDVYRSTNLLSQYSWELDATLEHNLDPLRYVADFDALEMYYSLGNGALDSDGDGLLDARELILFGTNPDSADSDGDGLSDGEEMLLYRLNPLSSDTDGDGLSDGYECGFLMIEAWGDNSYGQCNVPSRLTNVVAMAAGYGHSLALRSDGTVVAWGNNGSGQSNVPIGLNNVIEIDAFRWHSIALKADGSVTAWGYNFYGQCNVPSDLTNAIAIATGERHSLALRSDGTVVAWGANDSGQLNIPTGLNNVIAIAVGFNYNLALHSDGTVTAWGGNNTGQLNIPAGLDNVVAIAAGYGHCLALRSDGTVVAWGYNYYGQSTVPDGLSDVVIIKAGFDHSMALKSDGTVVAWGNNSDGESDVPTGVDNAITIAAGYGHSIALINPGLNPCAFDTDGDGLGDGWEVLYDFNPFDSTGESGADGDGLSDGWEIQYGFEPLYSTGINGGDGDPDNDDLTNLEEQTAGTDPWNWDTDGDTLSDGWEVEHELNPKKVDTDGDGLSDDWEVQYGTSANNWDTDGDLLSDSWEIQYGLNPLIANNALTEDIDADGLSLLDEYRYVTNPSDPDTDDDGVSDGDEIPHSPGSNPNDADDYGDPTNCVTMLLTVGDPSGSNSERWQFNVYDGDKAVVRHVDDGFGTPGSNEYALVKGKEYKYEITWIDHNQEIFDYDWQALINGLTVSGFYEGLYNTGGFIVEDPEDLLTTLYNGSEINEADGLEGRIIVPLSKISPDYDYSGIAGDAGDANTNGEYNVTGLVVPISTNNLGKIELNILPDDMDVSDIELAVEKTGDGDIKVWTTSTREQGSLLLYSLDANMMDTEWSLSESYHASEIPDTLYVEGVDDSSSAGDVSLILKVKYDDDIVTTTTQKITIVEMSLIPNYDRDGDIDGDDLQRVSANEVYRFWINDDNDYHDSADSGNDVPGASTADWESDDRYLNDYTYVIDGIRDFVDFFPVYIKLNDVLDILPVTQYDYVLKHAGNDVNVFIDTGLSHDQADYHLYNKTFAEANHGVQLIYIENEGYTLPASFLMAAADDEGVILVEGRATTTSPLKLEIIDKDTDTIMFEVEMPMSLSSVTDMYRFLNIRPDGVSSTNEPSNYPDSLCNEKNLFFLHGFKATEDSAPGWHAEFFKRLYWSGSNAKFWGTTWHSDDGTLTFLNYHLNVINAFEAGSNLWAKINYVPNKTFLAHSLGNMVVSSSIEDYGLDVDKYFMLNAAVPSEAYKATMANTATNETNYMLHEDWHGYLPKTWASKWNELFDETDNRSNLCWQGRFASVVSNAYNYYSSGDEVLEILDEMPGTFSGGILHLNRYTWHKQEIFKGTHGLGSSDWAGWGFYRNALFQRYYSLNEANSLSNSVLRIAPVFKHDPSELFQTNMTNAKVTEVLARGVPALSNPAGTAIISFETKPGFSFNMEDLDRDNDWPDRGSTLGTRWLHSDIKNVGYVYSFEFFDKIVTEGGLE